MKNRKIGLTLVVVGLLITAAIIGTLGRSLYQSLNTLTKPTCIAALGVVIVRMMGWYGAIKSSLFGIGGLVALGFFFAIFWIWMKRNLLFIGQKKKI